MGSFDNIDNTFENETSEETVKTGAGEGAGFDTDGVQTLVFRVEEELYGFEISCVREIIDDILITPVPTVPGFLAGLINLRGEIIPVIDLRARFFRKATDITKYSCIIIIELEKQSEEETEVVGVLVDMISSVVTLKAESIQNNPGFGARIASTYISSVARNENRVIVILNQEQVINIDELASLINMEEHQAHISSGTDSTELQEKRG